jgi:virginiamycin B lyase
MDNHLARSGRIARIVLLSLAVFAALSGPLSASPQHVRGTQLRGLRRFAIPTPNSGPNAIAPGPYGDLWFAENSAWKIARIGVKGTITELKLPAPTQEFHQLNGITIGFDRNIYITADEWACSHRGCFYSGNVYKALAPFGSPVFTLGGGTFPSGITRGPGANLWFGDEGGGTGGAVAEMSTSGSLTEFGTTAQVFDIVTGSDGNLWFSELDFPNFSFVPGMGMMTPSGVITLFPTPSGLYPGGVCEGPDGNVWFTEATNGASAVGKITPSGGFTEFPTPTAGVMGNITTGSDGNLWFTEASAGNIGRITRKGVITEFAVGGEPFAIASGPDGDIWFTDVIGNTVNRFIP